MKSDLTIFTIGHSTRTIEEFVDILKAYQIEAVVDIRTIPRSRHAPQFNYDILSGHLKKNGIEYIHMKGLGGLRHPFKDSQNTGWRNSSFRGFADYMQDNEFQENINALIEMAKSKRLVLMCAEAVPWRCHRSLIADALQVRKIKVEHILSSTSHRPHSLTSFAEVHGKRITYQSPGQAR
jgi:uncharacterized protein (DUF488 family)